MERKGPTHTRSTSGYSLPPSPLGPSHSHLKPHLSIYTTPDSSEPSTSSSSFNHWSSHDNEFVTSPSNDYDGNTPFTFPVSKDADRPTPTSSPSSVGTDRIFHQLNVIKSLQDQLAKSHAQLEGIGSSTSWFATSDREKEGGETKEREDIKAEVKGAMGTKADLEKSSKAYEEMKDEFEERQKSVDGIMDKLSSLSSALKTFHALPPPLLFPPTIRPTPPSSASARAQAQGKKGWTMPNESLVLGGSKGGGRPGMGRERTISFDG